MQQQYQYKQMTIKPSRDEVWQRSEKDKRCISICNCNGDLVMSIDLEQAQFIVKSLTNVIKFYNRIPQKSDYVKVIRGRFKDCEGQIMDIDDCDENLPILIQLSETNELVNCVCCVGYDDVAVIRPTDIW